MLADRPETIQKRGLNISSFIKCAKFQDEFKIELLSSGLSPEMILEIYPELSPVKNDRCKVCLNYKEYEIRSVDQNRDRTICN